VTSRSAGELAKKIHTAATVLPKELRKGVFDSSMETKRIFLEEAANAGLRPGQRMSGVGKRGAAWGVGFDIKGETDPTSIVRFRGPVHLVNNPSRPHIIAPKVTFRQGDFGRRSRSGKSRARIKASRIVAAEQLIGLLTGSSASGSVNFGRRAVSTPQGPRRYAKHPGTGGKDFWTPAKLRAFKATPRITSRALRRSLYYGGLGR